MPIEMRETTKMEIISIQSKAPRHKLPKTAPPKLDKHMPSMTNAKSPSRKGREPESRDKSPIDAILKNNIERSKSPFD